MFVVCVSTFTILIFASCGRKCDKCSKDMKTTYAPKRPEIVYCEECYLNEVY